MSKEQLIEKIKNLLELSSCPGTTEHERNLAYQKAQSLMVKYCVELDDLKSDEGIVEKIIEFRITYQPKGYLKNDNVCKFLMSEIAQAFGTFMLIRNKSELILLGFEANCQIANYVIHVLLDQGVRDYRDSLKDHPPTASHKISFWQGFKMGLKDRFTKISDERGVVLYDRVREYFKSRTTEVRLNNSTSSGISGFAAGVKSATDAQIHKPVESSNTGKLLN